MCAARSLKGLFQREAEQMLGIIHRRFDEIEGTFKRFSKVRMDKER